MQNQIEDYANERKLRGREARRVCRVFGQKFDQQPRARSYRGQLIWLKASVDLGTYSEKQDHGFHQKGPGPTCLAPKGGSAEEALPGTLAVKIRTEACTCT